MNKSDNRAFSLLEVSVAAALLATGAVSLQSLCITATRGTELVGRHEVINQMACSILEGQLSRPYSELAQRAGTRVAVDLALHLYPDASGAAISGNGLDGIAYSCDLAVDRVDTCPGLLRLKLYFRWEPDGAIRASDRAGNGAGALSMVRFVADPDLAMGAGVSTTAGVR